jgi:hypothetical protein
VNNLPDSVNTCIGTASIYYPEWLIRNFADGLFNFLLNGWRI